MNGGMNAVRLIMRQGFHLSCLSQIEGKIFYITSLLLQSLPESRGWKARVWALTNKKKRCPLPFWKRKNTINWIPLKLCIVLGNNRPWKKSRSISKNVPFYTEQDQTVVGPEIPPEKRRKWYSYSAQGRAAFWVFVFVSNEGFERDSFGMQMHGQ